MHHWTHGICCVKQDISNTLHNIITQVRRNMFTHNSSGEVRSFCEWNWTLVSFLITRGSDTSWETAVNIVPTQRAVLAFAMRALESDMTWHGGIRFWQHDKQQKVQTEHKLVMSMNHYHALVCDQPRIILSHDDVVSCLETTTYVPAWKWTLFPDSNLNLCSKFEIMCFGWAAWRGISREKALCPRHCRPKWPWKYVTSENSMSHVHAKLTQSFWTNFPSFPAGAVQHRADKALSKYRILFCYTTMLKKPNLFLTEK